MLPGLFLTGFECDTVSKLAFIIGGTSCCLLAIAKISCLKCAVQILMYVKLFIIDTDFSSSFRQLFLNGVSYGPRIPLACTGAKVSGLAGGRAYNIMLEAYTAGDKFPPRTSNTLVCIAVLHH